MFFRAYACDYAAIFRFPTKSIAVSLIIVSILSVLTLVDDAIIPKNSFVTTRAVNILTIIPAQRVTANPLIGPEPKMKRIIPVSRVVRLASTIVIKALSYAAMIAAQNAVMTAESFGLGSCYIGDIMENYEIHTMF